MPKSWIVTAAGAIVLMAASSAAFAAPDDHRVSVGRASDDLRVRVGRAIAPVPLDLAGKNRELVWLGSYIVNAQGGCNDCHTMP